jgi:hypothetical protein
MSSLRDSAESDKSNREWQKQVEGKRVSLAEFKDIMGKF